MTHDAMTALRAGLETALTSHLPRFLSRQRWFAGKARGAAAVTLDDVAELPAAADGDPPTALVFVRVAYDSGEPDRYAILVAATDSPGDAAVIAATGSWPGHGVLVEASAIESCAMALLAGFDAAASHGSGVTLQTRAGGVLRYGDLSSPGPFSPRGLGEGTVRPLGAEQSNTSLLVDRTHVFKLFRRMEPGENPEVEIGRFLASRTQFRAMPMLQGSLTLERDGIRHTAGVLQSFVPNEGDGWSWTLDRLREGGETPGAAMRALGQITADFHGAMASCADVPAFAPCGLTPAGCRSWTEDVRARLGRTLALIERARSGLPDSAAALADRVLGERGALAARATTPDLARGGFDLVRIHGDFHLGQTLRVPGGWILMDFEGEPARPLEERRTPSAALKDVAGMLRSFDYAVVAAGAASPDAARPLREAFLSGYDAHAGQASFLPAAPEARDAWIAFFELEKALYETEYEINNRPDWLPIPLRGVLRVLGQIA